MRNYLKKYLTGVGLFLIVFILVTTINTISYKTIGTQTATVADMVNATGALPASGFAWNDNVGWINFGTSTSHVEGRVYVSDNELYGYAWGENIGWISLNCANTESDSCTSYRVYQTNGDGELIGFAWGENIGWINFNPTGGGVSIDPLTGDFSGDAWGENIGWILFPEEDYGVKINLPACESFSYNPWSDCTSGTQTRTVATTTPPLCKDGSPELTQSCGSSPQTCTDFTYSWSACVNNIQTVIEVLTREPSGCQNGTPLTERACTPDIATTTPITISIFPSFVNMYVNATSSFSAKITSTSSDVIWSLSSYTAGTISVLNDQTAVFEAGTATGTFKIIAKVKNAPTISTSSIITISSRDVILPVSITIDPREIEVYVNQSVLFKSFVSAPDSADKGTTWIAMDEGGGTIDDNGLYTAPNIVGTFGVKAIAKADTNKAAVARVTVRLRPLPPTEKPSNNGGGEDVNNIVPILNIENLVTDNISILGTTTEKVILGAQKIVSGKTGSAVTKAITTAGVIGGGVAASSVLVLNGTVVADLLFLPLKLWALLLSFLGLKKRNRPWGTVYDSVTKQPIDPAYVTITNLDTKVENTSITDLDGRYGFLTSPGRYMIMANKTNYLFPSKKLLGKATDALYNNLYFGEEIKVDAASALLSKNIPMDPIKFDWNEFVKGQKKMMKFYSKREKILRIVTDWIFRIGFWVSVISLILITTPYNLIIFGLYLILTVLRKFGLKQKTLGALTEKDGNPLSFAIIRAISADLETEITNKVADKIGRYYCLVPKGKYYLKIEKKNDDESYSPVYTSPAFEAENGIINKSFVI